MPIQCAAAEQGARAGNSVTGGGLRIFQVMPRNMYFGASRATSIDLCVKDLVSFSRFGAETRIFAEQAADGFPGFEIEHLPPVKRAATFERANFVAEAARRERPDIIIVQQHLPTASALAARLPETKIILQTHNFQKSYPSGNPLDLIRRSAKKRRYTRLAGITHVSRACENAFNEAWPSIRAASCVVNNGLDFLSWSPAQERSPEILCIGRCAPEKGILEAAQGLAAVLPRFQGWRARFILSDIETHPDYFEDTRNALGKLGPQVSIEVQRPYDEIKHACEYAAIALVPSKWLEPFGRTALEAHAGGAALISSGTGGLSEISGESVYILPAIRAEAILSAVETLITDQMLRLRLGYEGAKRVRARFDIRTQAARLDQFCVEVARGPTNATRAELSPSRIDRLSTAE